jgi:hypothetical protein
MNFLPVVLELVGAYAATSLAFASGYAAYLTTTGRRTNLKWENILSFGILTPTIWAGMSALTGLLGAYWGLLPPNLSVLAYAAAASLIPASALSASVIDDINTPSPSPSRETSRKSISAPKRPSSNPPPPRYW